MTTTAEAVDGPGTADDTGDPNWPWVVQDPPGGSTISGASNAAFLQCQAERYRGALDQQCGGWGDDGAGSGPVDPDITSLAPNAGTTGVLVHVAVTGTGFENGSKVEANGAALPTTFVSHTRLTANYTPGAAGTVQFTVRNPSGKESNDAPFTVTAAAPPRQPTLTSMTPNTFVGPNHTGETVTLVGTNLDQALTAFSECPATIGPIFGYRADSPTQATLTFTTDLNMTGTPYDCDLSVWISDGAGGSLISNELSFTVAAPVPVLTAVTPTTGVSGVEQTPFLDGSGFASGCTIQADGVAVGTTFESATRVHANFTPAAPGVIQLTVRNPDGGVSNAVPFTAT
jgi:hypothetical protein